MNNELEDAIILANKVLDDYRLDPDGDLCILARQFLRALEREENLNESCSSIQDAYSRLKYPDTTGQ